MSLQTKFFLLVGVLALAVVSSLGAAWWAFDLLHSEMRTPFASSGSVMTGLRRIKRDIEAQSRLLLGQDPDAAFVPENLRFSTENPRTPTPEMRARFEELSARIDEVAARMRSDSWYRSRVGQQSWSNIVKRIHDAQALAHEWFEAGALPSEEAAGPGRPTFQSHGAPAVAGLYETHELIESAEGRILEDLAFGVRAGDDIRDRLQWWLLSVMLAAVLAAALTVLLLRRWVQRPVAVLRAAAAHFARGDLAHRVPVGARDELGLLSTEINHMAETVAVMQEERVQRERLAAVGAMLRRIVHNVRNPLSGIRGLAEVTRVDMPTGSEHRENLELIVSTVDTFERWLTELLDATNPVELDRRECEVLPFIQDLVGAHRPMAQVKTVRLELETGAAPATAIFDPKHLTHALAAVVANAIEATPRGGEVRVCVDADGSEWRIVVSDNGPGVPRDLAQRIFEPHFTTKKKGTGIGLAMAQHVLRAHGGRISVGNASEVPGALGARFEISIPFVYQAPALAENNHRHAGSQPPAI